MSNYGSGSFGSAVFGGDPTPLLLLQVDAEMTFEARHLLARGVTDGTSLQMKQFVVGRFGFDLYNYKISLPVNPDAVALEDPIFTDAIDYYETPNPQNSCAYCLLDYFEANETLGEVGILSEIQCSPVSAENGTQFFSHIGHFPLIAKNDSMRVVLRVLTQF